MAHKGMKFGIFLAPFHRLGENPTLAMARDMELIEWLDWLGYDEVWVGEHHSAGWELIASPEIFIAAAAERTRHIMLGSGVTSLPYHHPFLVAQRFVQLDHMTRGRTMLGCGPGALVSDAYMMGIEPVTQRPRMDEALDAIMLLLKGDEPVTLKTDWFEMRQARLHLAPYTEPHFPIAIASVMTPSGVIAAGRHGLGVLSLGAGIPGGPEALANQWKIGEETAARHGKTLDRKNWKLVVNVHVADDDEEAMRQVKRAERHETITYFEETLGRPPGRSDDPLTDGVKMGTTLVGSVETVIKGIEKLWQLSNGGFGRGSRRCTATSCSRATRCRAFRVPPTVHRAPTSGRAATARRFSVPTWRRSAARTPTPAARSRRTSCSARPARATSRGRRRRRERYEPMCLTLARNRCGDYRGGRCAGLGARRRLER